MLLLSYEVEELKVPESCLSGGDVTLDADRAVAKDDIVSASDG